MISKPGESKEQREAESFMIREMSLRLGASLGPKRFDVDEHVHADVDGFCEEPPIISEAWAHIGHPKSAQKSKVLADALKMVFLEKHLDKTFRKIIVFGDEVARDAFVGATWRAKALQAFNIQCDLVELPDELRAAVLRAQKRQYR